MENVSVARPRQNFFIASGVKKEAKRILLAEKDRSLREAFVQAFESAGYEIVVCHDGLDLLDHASPYLFSQSDRHKKIDAIIMDILLPGVTGLELLDGAQEIRRFPPIILILESCMQGNLINQKNIGEAVVLVKPFYPQDLIAQVEAICQN